MHLIDSGFSLSLKAYFSFLDHGKKRDFDYIYMLLRKRSRAVATPKPALMADHTSHSHPSPNKNYAKVIQSFFTSPKFRDFTTKCLSGADTLRSPTSILETIPLPFSPFGIPFSYDRNEVKVSSEKKTSWDKIDPKGIGVALVDEGIEQNSEKPNNGNVLFGPQLKVKIPPLSHFAFYRFESRTSDAGFGIKTQDLVVSPTGSHSKSQSSRIDTEDCSSGVVALGVLSLSEMELSEDYTCVTSHGPNPKTTHIFHNCVVNRQCSSSDNSLSSSGNFLSFCHTCKKRLEHSKDIFIYG